MMQVSTAQDLNQEGNIYNQVAHIELQRMERTPIDLTRLFDDVRKDLYLKRDGLIGCATFRWDSSWSNLISQVENAAQEVSNNTAKE